MLWLDASADLLYLGGSTNGVQIAKGGDLTLLGINAHCNPVAMSLHQVANKGLTFRRPGANDGALDTQPEHAIHDRPRAQSAAQFDAQAFLQDRLDRGQIARLALEGSVQVDDVNPPAAGGLELRGHRARVRRVHRLLIGATLGESDAAAALQINGRKNRHAGRE
jgi:hypothetical protein